MKATRTLSILPRAATLAVAAALTATASAQNLRGNNVVVAPMLESSYPALIQNLARKNVKTIRFQFLPYPFQDTALVPQLSPFNLPPTLYEDQWWNFNNGTWAGMNGMMAVFNRTIVPALRANRVKAVVELHLAPGAYTVYDSQGNRQYIASDFSLKADYQAIFTRTWERLSQAYKATPEVVAFDLWNEPRSINAEYLAMMDRTVARIRSAGFRKLVIVECSENPASIRSLRPIRDPARNIAYSFHMYQPHDFTHGDGRTRFDASVKASVDKFLGYVVDWQRNNGRPRIWVGEFGVMNKRGAEGNKYLNYLLGKFKQYNWDASYIGDRIETQSPNAVWDIDAAKLRLLSPYWRGN